MPSPSLDRFSRRIGYLLTLVVLAGCAAVGVPETSDPLEKLKWADELFDRQGRPLPAERLINEAIAICVSRNDQSCLGRAYFSYGFFFRSPSVEKNQVFYRKNGFYDKTVTYDRRLVKSKEYFEKAVTSFRQTNEYDMLTSAYLNLGFAFYFLGDHKAECEPYAKSLEAHRQNIEANPSAGVIVPKGFSSYEEYLAVQQKRAGCL